MTHSVRIRISVLLAAIGASIHPGALAGQDDRVPDPITDFRVEVAGNSVRFDWSVPGPGAELYFLVYEIRISPDGPVTDENWDNLWWWYWPPANSFIPGTPESFAVPRAFFEDGGTYWCAIRASIGYGQGGVSNNAVLSLDAVAPGSVTTLSATVAGETSVLLTWDAPGDDGGSGRAALYDLRYSTEPLDAFTFEDAEAAVVGPPSEAGAGESATVRGLTPATSYYFALKTADERPNWSALSNVAFATTAAPIVDGVDHGGGDVPCGAASAGGPTGTIQFLLMLPLFAVGTALRAIFFGQGVGRLQT